MKRTLLILVGVIAAGVLLAAHPVGAQEEFNPARRQPAYSADDARRVLVKFRENGAASRVRALAAEDSVAALAARSGVGVRRQRRLGAVLHVLDLDAAQSVDEQLSRVRADASVEYAALDQRRYVHALPNDPLYTQQWYLQANSVATPSAIDAEHAWDLTTGSTGVVIAVIDTGVRYEHPDLGYAVEGGRVLPGYDFISDAVAANDGDGRDADAADAGDFVSVADVGTQQFRNCDIHDSSWHGTRTSGLIAARTNNEGFAGGTWSSWIVPVRALGKCGGFDSDILPAMLWAGGVHVDGAPDNPYPAKIVNMSLGGYGPCSFAYQEVIDELSARGVLVVASAGNDGEPVSSPANCEGAVGVAGSRHAGTKVGYSNLGPEIAISAPAGNCVNDTRLGLPCLFPISTLVNFGETGPGANGYGGQFESSFGTSYSAPFVTGIAGLMVAANGNLGAAALRARLQEGASKPFPVSTERIDPTDPMSPPVPICHVPSSDPRDVQLTECSCTMDTCGAGMANALGAVIAALRPIAAVARPVTVSPGQDVPLSGVGSAAACNRTLASYAWSIVSGPGVILGNPSLTTAVVRAPTSGFFTVRLTVTDDQGALDFADIIVSPTAATSSAPATAGNAACLAAVSAPPQNVQVTVAPGTTSVQGGGTATFTATVTDTANTAVNWHVNGVLGGDATVGTISTLGTYVAPATVATATTVTVMAAWSGDATRTGSAQVSLTPPPPPAPPSSSGGGGAGGFLEVLALLGSLALTSRRRKDAAGTSS